MQGQPVDFQLLSCQACREGSLLGFDFSMALQPLVDVTRREVYGYEALVRGLKGESAYSIISQVDETNRYRFDQACRVKPLRSPPD